MHLDKAKISASKRDWRKTIFLAHANEDKLRVEELYNRLKGSGIQPWLDKFDIGVGTDWEKQINTAIKETRFFAVCITSTFVNKTGVAWQELRRALEQMEKKPPGTVYFIPILLDEIELPDLKVGTINLRDYNAARAFDEAGVLRLIVDLQKLLDIEAIIEDDTKEGLKEARYFVVKGDLANAFTALNGHLKKNKSGLQNSLILLLSRFNRLKSDNNSGILSGESYRIELNRITAAILDLIHQAENE